ncbi:MAG: hypothetical protein ACI834_000509, partial [Colwellia sp.]
TRTLVEIFSGDFKNSVYVFLPINISLINISDHRSPTKSKMLDRGQVDLKVKSENIEKGYIKRK